MAHANLGWYDRNEDRRFPLADDVSAIATNGTQLPDGLIVDLVIAVDTTVDPTEVYLSSVRGLGTGLLIEISDDVGLLATATIPGTHERYDSYQVTASRGTPAAGSITIGRPEVVEQLSVQGLNFVSATAQLAPTVIRPAPAGFLTQLVVEDYIGNQTQLSGDVMIESGDNIEITTQSDGLGSFLQIAAIPAVVIDDRYNGHVDSAGRRIIRTINGVAPDASGNVVLTGVSCIEFTPGTNSLTLTDRCAEPCCGCEELEQVTSGFQNLGDSQSDLRSLLNALQAKVLQLEQNFALSNIPEVT